MNIIWKWLRAFALFVFLVGFGGQLFAADMQPVSFTDSRDPAPSNGLIDFVVVLQNNVPVAAVNPELNVSIPDGFSLVSLNTPGVSCVQEGSNPSTGAAGDQVRCTAATFPGNTAFDINITLRAPVVNTPTVFNATATVTSDVEVNTANDSESIITTVVEAADLNLTKTSNPNPVIAGGIVTYRFDVKNNGPHNAINGMLTDTLPVGLTFIGDNATPLADNDANWSCSSAGQLVTCNGPDIAVNAISTFYFRAQVTSFNGDITNAATVTSDTLEVNPSDNTDTDVLEVTAGTDIMINKSVTTPTVIAGQNVTFTLDITNNGPLAADVVQITDILPAGYTNVSASGAGWNCDVNANPTLTCTRDDASMSVGVTETITVIAQTPNTGGIVSHQNSATVETTTDDPIPSNDTDTVTYDVNPDQADLRLTKLKSPTPVALGQIATSTINVSNIGPRPATPVQVVDALSANESYDSYSGTDWSCTHGGSVTGGVVVCDYSQALAVGVSAPALSILTKAETAGNLTNTACTGGSTIGGITSLEPIATDVNTANNCQSANAIATGTGNGTDGVTDIRVIKTTDDTLITIGENSFTYTVNVRNIGTDTGESVEFRDTIPQYVSALNGRPATTLTAITDKVGATCTINSALVVCDLGDMAVNDEVNVNITVARPMADGTLTNTASAYSLLTGDTDRSNNVDSVVVTVDPVADIELVSKNVTPNPVRAGTEATYTIQIRNNGPSTAVDVNLTDVFSGEAFTFISVASPVGSCTYDNVNTLTCNMGDMPSGTTHSVSMIIRPNHLVPAPATWEINNTATVTMLTVDSNLTNNEKSANLLVNNGLVDLAIEKSESEDYHEPVSFDPFNLASNLLVYKIEVQNHGPSLATEIDFIDRVISVSPDVNQNLTFLRDTENSDGTAGISPSVCTAPASNPFTPDAAAPTINCHISELAADSSYVRYIVFHVEDAPNLVSGDVYIDEINVTSRENEALLGNNKEDERTTVRVYTDPQIVKTVSKPIVEVGENFTYTLVVTNNGPGYSPLTNIVDNLPVDMELTGAPVLSPVQGSCTGTAGDTGFTCNVDESDGTLHSNFGDPTGINEVTITVPVRFVAYPGAGPVINTATVSTSGPDQNESNNESSIPVDVLQPAHIGNRVWEDRDADGRQDENTNLSGVTVELINSLGNVVQTTTTDSSGIYGFDVNSSGDYKVRIVPPAGYRVTTRDSASTTDLLDSDINATFETQYETIDYGENNVTLDAGFFRVASIGNRVWIDDNGNGRQDSGEAGVPNVRVRLYNSSNVEITADIDGTPFGVVTTDASGIYSFTNLRPGNYHVEFDKTTLPAEYVFTTRGASGTNNSNNSDANTATGITSNTLLTSNENDMRWDAGIFIPVSIGDYVWHDINGDGIQDSAENSLPNAGVQLFRTSDPSNPVLADLDGNVFATETNATGGYLFDNLRPDSYFVRFTAPNSTGYVITLQDQGTDNNDSDPDGFKTPSGDTDNYVLTSGDDNRSADAGFYVPITIGDRVWEDYNYNGIQDNGELNVSGVRVTLVTDGTLGSEFRDTNANGEYLFDDLPPGHAYSVQFTLPAGYQFTQQDIGSDDTLDSDANITTGRASGQTSILSSADENLTFDAGIYRPLTIGDYVWEDLDADGVQDGGEPGISGVGVELYINGIASGITTTTDGGGLYSFTGLLPNRTYTVAFTSVPSAEYKITTTDSVSANDGTDSDLVTLGTAIAGTPFMFSGEQNLTLDAGFYRDASLGNRVWIDANGNGIQDGGESNVPGVEVELFTAAGASQGTITTDANGLYHFENLRPGAYYVVFDQTTLPAGYVFTQKDAGGDNNNDSDVNLVTGRSDTVILVSNQDNNSTDAGIYLPVEVGDRIWLDTNANGIQDGGELNYTGAINVTLVDNNDPTNTYTVITNNGDYNITDVRPGNYHVEFTLPAGYVVSPNNTGSDDAVDSDVSGLSTGNFDLVSGINQYTWDMGIYQTASIGDRIWLDTNADGIQDADELNVTDAGITIELLDDGNNIVQTQNGVTNGAYSFTGVTPGNYHVKFILPAGYVVSPQNVTGGSVDYTTDSDVNATEIAPNEYITDTTTLSANENDPSWDMGVYQPASIGDRIWLDTNGNGIQDGSEINYTLGTVTVYLENENNTSVADVNGNPVAAVTTNTGTYAFTNLIPGTYHVRFEFPADTQISPLNTGAVGSDSDVRLDTNATVDTVLVSGENDTTWDAGIFLHAGLGDQLWIDTNGNGIQDDAEVLDINVTVNLYYNSGSLADTQTIAAGSNGTYSFINVDPDDYYVEFVLPGGSGYQFIAADAGGDDTIDSDVNAAGRTPTETISSNEFNETLDAGIYIPASLGDRVWLDANANGIQDSGENNVSDINVTLYNDQGAVVGTTVTALDGSYTFSGLVPGDYTVAFALTDNNGQDYVVTPQVGVQDDADNSDVNATGGSSIITLISGANNPNIDAGLYIPVSVGDFVWSDANGNGLQDDGVLSGIQDVNVTLYREEDNGTITTIGSQDTDSSGGYLFTALVPGNYYVYFAQPDHFRPTGQNSGSDDAIDSDADTITGNTAVFELFSPDDNLTLDAGFYALATISGNVSEDTDNDDIGDINLQSVDIDLVDSFGTIIASTQTDINGDYVFIDVEPGDYTIVETQPAGFANVSEDEGGSDDDPGNTTLDNIIAVHVDIGEIDVNNDFVEEAGVTIGDRVWNDVNGDGIQDPTETNTTGLDGIVVNLFNDLDMLVATTLTDANGEYLFENYPEDVYYIGFDLTTLPEHYGVTQQDQGSDDTNDSDTLIATGITGSDYLAPGEDNRTFDMGIYLLGTISGMVLEDINNDDIGDNPMAGVEIILYDENGNEVARTLTAADGTYIFTDLPQGVYTIIEIQPSGYLNVGETDGDLSTDGIVNSITVTLDAGEHDADNDYIEEIGGSIGNYVWHDADGNGLQDPEETGVNAVRICLEHATGNAVLDANGTQRCTITDATGYYLFEGIIPGDYVVVFEIPDGTTLTPLPQEGSDTAVDSDPLEVIGDFASAPVTIGLGDDILTIDMGLVYLNDASIGDFVWIDENVNGIFDPGEVGLDGVTVNLYNETGALVETIITHNGGYYLFEHLSAGTYVVEFIVPKDSGYIFSETNVGAEELDSDADTTSGRTDDILLSEGEHIVVVDAGVNCGCSNVSTDSSDALSTLGTLGMMLLTLMIGLYYVRKEELIETQKRGA